MASNQAALLLKQQLRDLNKNPSQGFSAGLLSDDDLFKWEVMIIGPESISAITRHSL